MPPIFGIRAFESFPHLFQLFFVDALAVVAHANTQMIAVQFHFHPNVEPLVLLHAVGNRVFHQRLKHHLHHTRVHRFLRAAADVIKLILVPNFLNRDIAFRHGQFFPQRRPFRSGIQHIMKQIRKVFNHVARVVSSSGQRHGAPLDDAHGVIQKMRIQLHLQRLQFQQLGVMPSLGQLNGQIFLFQKRIHDILEHHAVLFLFALAFFNRFALLCPLNGAYDVIDIPAVLSGQLIGEPHAEQHRHRQHQQHDLKAAVRRLIQAFHRRKEDHPPAVHTQRLHQTDIFFLLNRDVEPRQFIGIETGRLQFIRRRAVLRKARPVFAV